MGSKMSENIQNTEVAGIELASSDAHFSSPNIRQKPTLLEEVGATGFEPATSEKWARCSTIKLHPALNCDTGFLLRWILQESITTDDTTVIACYTAIQECTNILHKYGSRREKQAYKNVLRHVLIVPDRMSERFRRLTPTRNMGQRDLIIFGTGDFYQVPTVTTDAAFARSLHNKLKCNLQGPGASRHQQKLGLKPNLPHNSSQPTIILQSPVRLERWKNVKRQ